MKKCKCCKSILQQDTFGEFCPNDACASVNGINVSMRDAEYRCENKLCMACGKPFDISSGLPFCTVHRPSDKQWILDEFAGR